MNQRMRGILSHSLTDPHDESANERILSNSLTGPHDDLTNERNFIQFIDRSE
ncbi:hypothetical protein [Virgibacillus sp. YIM 98842]|uniref:hypothetical protein n=1 Tax=Virgibacillus sp. YIM 98842 TaxID=2663533 RepID=UPI0013DC7FA2|nr:hypothetical protein [Virgibacillus sp. YIM 98842]